MPNERETLKTRIDEYLKTLAPNVWNRKKWGGGVYQHEGDWDWFVCAWGSFGVIEAKHPITHPDLAPAQKLFGQKIKAAGGFCIEATGVHDVRNGLKIVMKNSAYPYA